MTQAYESRLNIILSQLLEQQGIVSRSEFIGRGRKDIIVYHQGLAIVLEGSYDKLDALNDALVRSFRFSQKHLPRVFHTFRLIQEQGSHSYFSGGADGDI